MIINKNYIELTDQLKGINRDDISLKTYFGEESKFNINFDYDRFIINKEAKPFRKNGILEVHSVVKISSIDKPETDICHCMTQKSIIEIWIK